ncbi:MAG: hypothetical protein AAGA35_04420 [Patescibacteria group bacterium]
MLHIYCGNDTIQVREKAFAHVQQAEVGGVRVHRVDAENFVSGMLADALGAVSLFGEAELYLLDIPSTNKDFAAEVKEALPAMAESSNQFVVIEGALLAADKKPYQKHASEFEELKAAAGERFNTFAMADALARKDKKSLWLLLQQAKLSGIVEEEIIGTLWWQLKALRLAAKTSSAAEAGMKDFPYNKAKRALSKFKDGEVNSLAQSLLMVYHDGHNGTREIDLALEKWCLTI